MKHKQAAIEALETIRHQLAPQANLFEKFGVLSGQTPYKKRERYQKAIIELQKPFISIEELRDKIDEIEAEYDDGWEAWITLKEWLP